MWRCEGSRFWREQFLPGAIRVKPVGHAPGGKGRRWEGDVFTLPGRLGGNGLAGSPAIPLQRSLRMPFGILGHFLLVLVGPQRSHSHEGYERHR